MTKAQRSALEAISEEAIILCGDGHYYTLGTKHTRARQSVVERVRLMGYAETVFRGDGSKGVLVLTDAGRDALQDPLRASRGAQAVGR